MTLNTSRLSLTHSKLAISKSDIRVTPRGLRVLTSIATSERRPSTGASATSRSPDGDSFADAKSACEK